MFAPCTVPEKMMMAQRKGRREHDIAYTRKFFKNVNFKFRKGSMGRLGEGRRADREVKWTLPSVCLGFEISTGLK